MPIDIDTLVVVATHASGRETVRPLADLAIGAHGTAPMEELRLYLESHLVSARAETRASFSTETTFALRLTTVPLSHEGTPERFRADIPVSVASLVATDPHHRGTWVIVLPIAHTFWVARADDLDEAIRAETKRIVAASLVDPSDFLRLLPPDELRAERLVVELAASGAEAAARARKHHRQVEEAHRKKAALEVLESVTIPWHRARSTSAHPEIVGRREELASLRALLESPEKASVLLVGEELVGKSALVGAWFDDARARGAARPIYQTSAAHLLAGMSGLGQWQARVRRVLEAVETLDAILYFESLSELFGDLATGSVDVPGMIKPFLDEGRARVVAEVDRPTLDVLEPRHAGFFSAFTRLRVPPLDREGSRRALEALARHHREHEPDRPQLSDDARTLVVDLVDRYFPYLPHPGKAVRLYAEVRAAHEKDPSLVGMAHAVTSADVERHFALDTGIPRMLLGEDTALDTEEVIASLARRVVGQRTAVRRLAETVAVMKAALSPGDKPLGVFLFVGPTGVGKTELARALAELVFGSESRLVRFDMSELSDPSAAQRLILGTDRKDGLLTRAVRQQPFGIVLLDEIEKAHPAVFDLLLGALGEARLTDGRGKTAFLHNTIVIMTSNVGARGSARRIGIGATAEDAEDRYLDAARAHFRPEFLNRLDRMIPFHPLDQDQIREIARKELARIARRRGLVELGVSLDLGDEVIDRLAERGFSEAHGARALRRTLEDDLVVPVAELLARQGGDVRGASIVGTLHAKDARPIGGRTDAVDRAGIRLSLVSADHPPPTASGRAPHATISSMRRAVDGWFHLPGVERMREQVDFLVAQMNDLARAKKAAQKKRAAILLPSLQIDHHRLSGLSAELASARRDLATVEELSLVSLLAGVDDPDLGGEAYRAFRAFRARLPYALLALEPVRDAATFLVQEPDDRGGFTRWLVPLLEAGPSRGFAFSAHVPATFVQPRDDDWDADRFWGPPQSAEWLRAELLARKQSIRDVLLTVKGPYAGALLALESGLHRWVMESRPNDAVHLLVTLVVLRATLDKKDFASPLLRPVAAPAPAERRRVPAVREHRLEAGTLVLRGGRATMTLDDPYWDELDRIACEHLLTIAQADEDVSDALREHVVHVPGSEGAGGDGGGDSGAGPA